MGLCSDGLDRHQDLALGPSPCLESLPLQLDGHWLGASPPAWKTPQRGGPGLSPEPVPGACWGWRRRGPSRSRSWRGRLPRRGRGLSAPGAAALIAVSTALLKVATSGRELSGGFPVHGPICDHRHLVCSWSPRRYRLHLLVMQN